MKVTEFVETWLATVETNRKPKTYIQYKDISKRYILPNFGSYRLQDLQPIRLEKYLVALRQGGLGERTVQLIYAVFHVFLESAVKKRLIGRNPMDAVEKPKVKSAKKHIRLDANQVQQFLIAAEKTRNGVLYQLEVQTGLREGEILGLKWTDLDWGKRRIKIQRQVQRLPKMGLVIAPPKTEAGEREIPIGLFTLQKLQEHRHRQQEERTVAGDRWQEQGFMFPSSIGTPMDPHNLLKDFKKIMLSAGLPELRFHDLRHTSLTLLMNEIGAPIKEVQRRAGHTSPITTISIYGGDTTSKQEESDAQKLDELITPVRIELHQNCTKEESLPDR
jgi:integrase